MMMHRLASCLILLIADDFLTDAETRRWATSCFECLRALRRYPIKQVIPLPQVEDLIQRTTDAATVTVFPYPTIRLLHFGIPSRVLVGHWQVLVGSTPEPYRLMMANLPKTVRTLEMEWNFDDDISVFPSHLRSLRFQNDLGMGIGGCFNRSVTNWRLPESLLELHFPTKFNQCLDGLHLPSQLRSFILGRGFKHSIRSLRLPAGLETFSAGGAPDIPQLPSSLLRLRLGDIVDSTLLSTLDWPPSLTEVEWGSFSEFNASLQGVHLPNSVRSLSLPYRYNLSLEDFSFPTSLTRLQYGDEEYSHLTPLPWENAPKLLLNGNQSIDRLISIRQATTIPFPPLLTSVSFVTIPESLRPSDWPLCVRELYLESFKQPLASVHLPQHLEVLVLCATLDDKNKRFSELLLPPSLLEFHIGRYCDDGTLDYAPWSSYYSLHGLHLPDGLRVFSFLSKDHYAGSLADLPSNVPSSLRQLRLLRDDQWDHQAWRQWPIPDDCCVDIQQPEGGPLPDDWDNGRDM